MTPAQIIADLQRIVRDLDFRRNNLGRDLLDMAAEEVLEGMDRQEDPDGFPWIPLSDAYDAWKSAHFPAQPMAVLYGHMKTRDNVRGVRVIEPTRAEMTYGLDEQVRDEAAWFQDPTNPNQPARRFYGLSPHAIQRADAIVNAWFNDIAK